MKIIFLTLHIIAMFQRVYALMYMQYANCELILPYVYSRNTLCLYIENVTLF